MGRVLLLALAAITVALGVLMDTAWLLYAAGAFLLLAFVVLVALAAKRRARRAGQGRREAARSPEDELRSLGISDIRPKGSEPAPADRTPRVPPPLAPSQPDEAPLPTVAAVDPVVAPQAAGPQGVEPDEIVAGGAAATEDDSPAEPPELPDPAPPVRDTADHPFWETHSPTALSSFLRALWAAAEVQTALLAAAEPDGTYTLLGAQSHSPAARREGRLDAPLFAEAAPERALTVFAAGDPLLRSLPYYRVGTAVGEAAVLPVSGDDGAYVLAADLAPDQTFTGRQRRLLRGFADLLGTMLAHPPEEPAPSGVPTRRAVVADEMARARAEGHPLALALVYRADAEAVAETGGVAEAERELRLLLEDAGGGRLEPFGELMFGAFLHDDREALDAWTARVRRRAAEAGTPVGIGVARLADHADADALRADAANALAEALTADEAVVV